MTKNNYFVGVDVSKDKFDVGNNVAGHRSYLNDSKGYRQFFKQLPANSFCTMEATASYYQQLAMYLSERDIELQ